MKRVKSIGAGTSEVISAALFSRFLKNDISALRRRHLVHTVCASQHRRLIRVFCA
jgi:hypothetical protein|tara:strand:- start:15009 stop:15173 length:165 start_codon:yes stop_codon:yes gene_type:complete